MTRIILSLLLVAHKDKRDTIHRPLSSPTRNENPSAAVWCRCHAGRDLSNNAGAADPDYFNAAVNVSIKLFGLGIIVLLIPFTVAAVP